jgi:hypothetical protein
MRSEQVNIMVFEVAGSSICVSSDDGQIVHDRIAAALREGKKVKLSFMNVESLTSAFLNAAIGQLYGEFSEEVIRGGLSVTEMAQNDMGLLKQVVVTAKEFFRDPSRFKKAHAEALEEKDVD